ncbi:MAG: hypothetical protein K5979_07660 [Ruminococcus sp.]|nr:hypothetical protein [Ruminococcus sp.]
MYKFRNADENEQNEKDSLGCVPNVGEWIYGAGVREEVYALFLGKMIALFGKSDTLSDDWENMYTYPLVAEDENGTKLRIDIYHGSGGPSYCIPWQLDDEKKEIYINAVKELVAYIENAQPADYVHESVYYDIPANVTYTVKDGKAKVDSSFPEGEDFDPEDFM